MIVADTGAVLALIDADDPHHGVLRAAYELDEASWVLPWAILPEVDYLLMKHLGASVSSSFIQDLAEGRWIVNWGAQSDLKRANELCLAYPDLQIGMTDAIVMATAERVKATAIATLDLRDFAAVTIRGAPKLWPRDLYAS